jgi:hypothetical protein
VDCLRSSSETHRDSRVWGLRRAQDPVAFKAQLKRAQDMRMVQLQALLGQVASLDPADPEVSHQPSTCLP